VVEFDAPADDRPGLGEVAHKNSYTTLQRNI
jgi:hypothetical protein